MVMETSQGMASLEIPVFRLDGGEMRLIARDRYRLDFNELSPFRGQPAGGSQVSEEGEALLTDPDFREMIGTLAQPQFKLAFLSGGPAGNLGAFAVYGRRENKLSVVGLEKSGEAINAMLFGSSQAYGEYFAMRHAVPVPLKPVNILKTEVPREFVAFLFALADCYRRAYLNNLLAYSLDPVEGIYEDEFVGVFEQELKGLDPRWLVPSLFRLIPGLGEVQWEFSKAEVDLAEAMDFISRAASPQDRRPIFLLGANGKYLGLEFSLFWKRSVGLETWGQGGSANRTQKGSSYYLAFTEEANHIFEFTGSNGEKVLHKALDVEGTAAEIAGIIDRCLA